MTTKSNHCAAGSRTRAAHVFRGIRGDTGSSQTNLTGWRLLAVWLGAIVGSWIALLAFVMALYRVVGWVLA